MTVGCIPQRLIWKIALSQLEGQQRLTSEMIHGHRVEKLEQISMDMSPSYRTVVAHTYPYSIAKPPSSLPLHPYLPSRL